MSEPITRTVCCTTNRFTIRICHTTNPPSSIYSPTPPWNYGQCFTHQKSIILSYFLIFKVISKVRFLYYLIFEENLSLVSTPRVLYFKIELPKISKEEKQVFAGSFSFGLYFLSYYCYRRDGNKIFL